MAFALSPDALAAGYGLVAHETIGSTSTDAMTRLRDGATAPFWVVARRQSAGRGRRGSAWSTEGGNLAASLAFRLDAPPATVATLGFVAGVALLRALDGCCASFEAGLHPAPQDEEPNGFHSDPHAEVRASASLEARIAFSLKWPNDVLAGGAKLAGILLETEDTRQGRAVVVGIGVNVAHAPDGLAYRTASLRDLGSDATAEALFAALSAAWVGALAEWDGGAGFEAIRVAWLARAEGLGGPVSVRAGGSVLSGIFETIDSGGRLVLRVSGGDTHIVSAGDVFFGNAAGVRGSEAA